MERGPVVRANVCLLSDRRQVAHRDGGDQASFKGDVLGMFPSEKKKTHERVSRKYRASCKYRELFRKEVRRMQENTETRGVSSMADSGAQQKRAGTRETEGVWSEEE